MNKNRVFFYHIKKYHFSSSNQKNFFLWKVLVALIILQKSFCQKLPSLIRFWHSELHTQFQPLKIVHFSFKILHFSFKILTKLRKFTCLKITLIFRPSYDHQCIHFFPKTFFCIIINATRRFHKKNFFWYELEKWYFLIW